MTYSALLADLPVSSDYVRECLKTAIALNNIAVGLLVRGFYRYALDTFQDATMLIKCVAESDKGASVPAKDEVLRLPLQRAWQRAALPRRNHPRNIHPSDSYILKVVSSEYDPTTIAEALTIGADSRSTTKFPMTIDPIDFESMHDMLTAVDFHSSVLLYNFAIAYECWATTTLTGNADSCAQEPLHARLQAYRIFQLSRSALVKQYRLYREKFASNFYAVEKIMQLNLFLTHNLIEASSHLGVPSEYQEHCNNMDELLLLIKSGELLLPITEHRGARAA